MSKLTRIFPYPGAKVVAGVEHRPTYPSGLGKKNVLVVAAHMDDEVLGCGGTIARHAAAGDNVSVIWFTDGVGSRSDSPSDAVQVRRREAAAAWKAMRAGNLSRLHKGGTYAQSGSKRGQLVGPTGGLWWWARDYPDQRLDTVPLAQLAEDIANAIRCSEAHVVYTHWPHDLNQDHRAVSQATLVASRAWTGRAPRLLAYEVSETTEQAFGATRFAPTVFIDITKFVDRKVAALECYVSECRHAPHPRSWPMVYAQAAVRGSTVGVSYAEAFALLREVVS